MEVYICKDGQNITGEKHKVSANYSIPKSWTQEYVFVDDYISTLGLNIGDEICFAFKATAKQKNWLLLDNVNVTGIPEAPQAVITETE